MKIEVTVTVDDKSGHPLPESRASWVADAAPDYPEVCEQASDFAQKFVRPAEDEVYGSGNVEVTVRDGAGRRYDVRFKGQIPEGYFRVVEAWIASFSREVSR